MQFIIIYFILSMFQWLSFITEFILYDHVMSSVFCDHIFTVLINNSLFLHLHQFHWFISLIMSRWFHTESDHSMTATDVRVHYLHSWSRMMKCLHKCFPSVISEWRKWKNLNQSHAVLPQWIWCVFLKVWRSQNSSVLILWKENPHKRLNILKP